MKSFVGSVKLRSLRLWSAIAGISSLVGLAGATSGCIIISDSSDEEHVYVDPGTSNTPPDEVIMVTIDTGATMSATPGAGVGLFVEYSEGGHWRLWTTCDTNSDTNPSGLACAFDVQIAPEIGDAVKNAEMEALEGNDFIDLYSDGTARFYAETDSDTDGVRFNTAPGALLRLDMYLDGQPQPRFVYWVGDGIQHEGAPSNPVDFEPSVP